MVYLFIFEPNLKLKIMKKLILTLLLTSLASYSQINLNLEVANIIPVDYAEYSNSANSLTVPANRFWIVQSMGNNQTSVYVKPPGFESYKIITGNINASNFPLLPPGTKVFFTNSSSSIYSNIIEFNAPSTQTGTLALNEIKEINNKIELFPNPTNSKIALNSEKNYTIEVYDMQGQIVMKDKGNTVDLSNLSNAVYILKAYDNYEKTTTSYKVVKK